MRNGLPRAVIPAVVIALVAGAVTLGALLMRDPFADLPDDTDVTVNLAGSFPADGEEPLVKPVGIAIGGNRVFVADAGAGLVRIFDRYGRDRGAIVLPATDGVPARPIAVALAASGRIAVVDGASEQVLVFDARAADEPEVLLSLGNPDESTAPVRPVGVAYAEQEFYVVGTSDPVVRVYDSAGVLVRELGGSIDPPVEYPGGVTVAHGVVYVSDTKSGRVVALDAQTGDVAAVWPDTYTVPRGLAAAGDGFAVADVLGQAVYVCDADGARTHTLSADTVPEMPLVLPEGVAWDAVKSRLYATDSVTGRVVVFNVRRP